MNEPCPADPETENQLENPQQLDAPPWLAFNTIVTPGYQAADGSVTAVLLRENTNTHHHDLRQTFGPAIGGAIYSLSCHAKAGLRQWLELVLWDHGQADSGGQVWFDLTTGKIGATRLFGNSAAHLDCQMQALDDGWYRCELRCRVSMVATAGRYTAQLRIVLGDGNDVHAGDGMAGLLLSTVRVSCVEPVGTTEQTHANLLHGGTAIGQMPWAITGTGVRDGYAAPDGTDTAVFLQEADDTGEHDVRQVVTSVIAGLPYTFSCICKASSRDWVRLVLWDHGAANSGASACFNLTLGVLGQATVFGDSAAGLTSWMEWLGNGWYRCVLSCVVSGVGGADQGYTAQVQLATGDGTVIYQGDASFGLLVWDARLEPWRKARALLPGDGLALGETAATATNPGGTGLRVWTSGDADILHYGYNPGGLNNQKLALLGLFLAARRAGPRRIMLPDCYAADPNMLSGHVVAFDTVFDTNRVCDFAKKFDIEIVPGAPRDTAGGWDYFVAAHPHISRNMAVRNLGPDDFCCAFLRAIEPRINQSSLGRRLAHAVFAEHGVQVVLQLRVELDWVRFTNETLASVASALEDCDQSFLSMIRKTRTGLGASAAGILVTCDEDYLPFGKDVIRDVVRKDLGIELIFKTDLLSAAEWAGLSRLDLSLLDFELAVAAPFYVGQSRSSYSTMVGLERYARGRSPVTNHFIYNIHGPGLGQRTDNGAYTVPEQVLGIHPP